MLSILAAFLYLVLGCVWVLLKLIVCFALGAIFLLWYEQGLLLYIPYIGKKRQVMFNSPRMYRSPSYFNLDFENIYIETKDKISVHAWFVKTNEEYSNAATIIYFHGNAANIGHRLGNVSEFVSNLNVNVLMLEYRGYGNSEGYPSEHGLRLDAEAALNYIKSRSDVNQKRVYLFGQSLGGAVAISCGANNSQALKGVILENTFTSIFDMVLVLAENMGLCDLSSLRRIMNSFFLTSVWNSEKAINRIRVPILFLSGQEDELVPPEQMRKLRKSTKNTRVVWEEFPTGTHNETTLCEGYIEAIGKFLDL